MPALGPQSTIGFIGAGAVGGTLAVALEQAGYRVVAPRHADSNSVRSSLS